MCVTPETNGMWIMDDASSVPRTPTGLRAAGRRLWDSVTGAFELEEHEIALLTQAVRTVDLLEQLDAAVRRDGPLGPDGRAHPAAVEARQQRIALARMLAALRLPSGDEDASRPQRRVGARGVYGVGGGPARLRRVPS